jgi:hypothetical protein
MISTSWKETKAKGSGNISILWYDIEPFIYRNSIGGIMGVEYELMEGFKGFLKQKYSINLDIDWMDAGAFENIYPEVRKSKEKGLFGLSFYSITDERKKEVKFSPPYMPDLNVLVTNNNLPVYDSDTAFINDLNKLKGYTMKQTTMEEDILKLKETHFPALPVFNELDDYRVLQQIAIYQNSFGYVPVSIYVVALQRGIKIKRQRVLATRREGFAAIYTMVSDWDEPVHAYFNSAECKVLVSGLIRKYLGSEVAEIITNVSAQDTRPGGSSDIELLTKEREIVTQRLINTALDAERSKTRSNIFFVIGCATLLIAVITYSRFRTKSRLSKVLQNKNHLIADQRKKLEELNVLLNMKILQSRLNPHFLFNSLNAIQYHIGADDKKGALHYITRFATFLRGVLQSSDEILISVPIEASLAEQYLWLEKNRFPDRFHYNINVIDGAGTANTPPLLLHSILQEALYNNILNGNPATMHSLTIDFMKKHDHLLIRICDNGITKEELLVVQKKKETPATNNDVFNQRITAINKSAKQPVTFTYRRKGNENVTELIIPQPLFNK